MIEGNDINDTKRQEPATTKAILPRIKRTKEKPKNQTRESKNDKNERIQQK